MPGRPVLYVKPGVRFDRIAPAGFMILWALQQTARVLGHSLTVTSGTDSHFRSNPHGRGEAFDVRSRTVPDKPRMLRELLLQLSEGPHDAPAATAGGWATKDFFGCLEAPGTKNEHVHCQLRKGRIFP